MPLSFPTVPNKALIAQFVHLARNQFITIREQLCCSCASPLQLKIHYNDVIFLKRLYTCEFLEGFVLTVATRHRLRLRSVVGKRAETSVSSNMNTKGTIRTNFIKVKITFCHCDHCFQYRQHNTSWSLTSVKLNDVSVTKFLTYHRCRL